MSDNTNNSEPNEESLNDPEDLFRRIPNPVMPPLQTAIFGLVSVFLLYQIGGSLLTLAIFGLDFQNADLNALRLLTGAGQFLLILVPSLILTKYVYHDVSFILRIKLPGMSELLIFITGLVILIPLLQSFLYVQSYLIELWAGSSGFINSIKQFLDTINEFVEKTYSDLLRAENLLEAALIIIVVSITPAICEEIFFRGFIQRSFEFRFSPLISSVITAVFFGFYHFNPYGLIALIILGVYLGFAAYMSNSIVVPMILHFLNNFTAIMIFFIFGSDDFMETNLATVENIPTHITGFIILAIVFTGFIFLVKKYYSSIKRSRYDLSKV
ncbi:MAG: CPBP family intramembrane metalloprotease [Melioribacteraceae bacterium]|nr:CPBP family intramembrane metalloprotease [Melioribacteraceae bacterium]